MGLYSTVMVKRLAPCPRCGHEGDIQVQFHYGDISSHRGDDGYKIGDLIERGEQDERTLADGVIEVLGYPEWCPVCGLDINGGYALTGDPGQHMAEYVLTIQDGRITAYRQATAADVERIERVPVRGWPFQE